MSGLKYTLVFVCVLVAAFLSFVVAGRYALHAPADNYVWPERPAHATILFGGDMMFDRSVRRVADEKGGDFIFSCIDSVLQGADLVVANLEGPITEHASVSATSTPGDEFNYTFTFPPAADPPPAELRRQRLSHRFKKPAQADTSQSCTRTGELNMRLPHRHIRAN